MLDVSLYACINSTSELLLFSLTNTFIWNESAVKVYSKVSECYYIGSIHSLICTNNNTQPVCDGSLFPVYSDTGMVCNSTCANPEFNLSINTTQCMSKSCAYNKIVLNSSLYACLYDIYALQSYLLTSQYIWNQT
jgi:hypothetical protein